MPDKVIYYENIASDVYCWQPAETILAGAAGDAVVPVEIAERGINRSQHNIKHTQRGIENSKQQVEERVKQVQTEQRIKSRGWSR